MKQCSHCLAVFEDTINECPEDNIVLQSSVEYNEFDNALAQAEVDDSDTDTADHHIDPLIGSILAERYQIVSLLGKGGMGTVYKAQHVAMDRSVAVKILHAHLASRANALKRFHEEAKTIAQLRHHNIITLYDFDISSSNQPFLVMDYVDGFSLKKRCEDSGVLQLEQIGAIFQQIVDGLSYAHSENVVHRDLKPENIMLTKVDPDNYKVILVDFGLATLAMENSVVPAPTSKNASAGLLGSPFYMSPEQCLTNAPVDNRSDIYSLAIVIYEALSGRLPYERKSGIAMLENHLHKQPLPFNLTQPSFKVCSELTRVFGRALAKEAEERYPTITDFGEDMMEALQRDTVKWKAVKHRSLVARQTMTKTGIVLDRELTSVQDFDETVFQTGTKFLSRQAEIEAELFKSDKPKKENNGGKKKNNESQQIVQKQCLYCGATMPAGIQFCLSCQRKIQPRSTKLSETYNCLTMDPSDLTAKDQEQIERARSNIRSLRSSNLSVTLAKMQRYLIYAITFVLLITVLMISRSYIDINKSAKILSSFVNVNTSSKPSVSAAPIIVSRKKHTSAR